MTVRQLILKARAHGIRVSVGDDGRLELGTEITTPLIVALDALAHAVIAELQGRHHDGCACCGGSSDRLVVPFFASDARICPTCCETLADHCDRINLWPSPSNDAQPSPAPERVSG